MKHVNIDLNNKGAFKEKSKIAAPDEPRMASIRDAKTQREKAENQRAIKNIMRSASNLDW